ncbi:MAG: helix-turn-helix transcriptional regulator [Bacteroidales bacterium]|nr:helix-turn-helix transcriptional regulator [Bacteroidales bacterium]
MSISEIALLSPIFICLIQGIQLWLLNFKYPNPKFILGCFMIVSAILHSTITVYQTGNFYVYRYFDGVFMSFLLIMQPLFYTYTLSLTSENMHIRNIIWHYIPAIIVFVLSVIIYSTLNTSEQIYYLKNYMNGIFNDNPKLRVLFIFFHITKFIYLSQVFVYFIFIIRQLLNHRKDFNNMFSSSNDLKLNWLFVFTFIYFMVSINSIVVNFIPTHVLNTKEILLNISLLIFSIFYFVIGYMGMQQVSVIPIIQNMDREIYHNYSNKESSVVLNMINKYMIKEKAYLKSDIRIWDLCKQVNCNRTYVSKAINESLKMNFNDYVNKLRIEEACKLIDQKSPNYTFDVISNLCGFNSITTFNRAFKKFTNQTPAKYKKIMKV